MAEFHGVADDVGFPDMVIKEELWDESRAKMQAILKDHGYRPEWRMPWARWREKRSVHDTTVMDHGPLNLWDSYHRVGK